MSVSNPALFVPAGPPAQARPAEGVLLPLRDRTPVHVRPLVRGDRATVRQVFDGLSADSRFLRFLTPMPRLPGPMLARLADADGVGHVAWQADLAGRPIGIGRYFRDGPAARDAEVALEVVDEHQGRGVGRLLLGVLGAVAVRQGLATFCYLVHPANPASLALLRPFLTSCRRVDGLLECRGPLPVATPAAAVSGARAGRAA